MRTASTALIALTFGMMGCVLADGQQVRYYESFEEGVPNHFAASRPDSLSISAWHYKQGSNSLRWDWSGGEELVIHHGIGDVARVGGYICRASFSVWLYMEEPISDAIVFEFREGDRVTGWFRFPLEFTGWRQGRLSYQDFPNGQPTSDVNNIRIAAPRDMAQGTVFLDFIKYNTLTQPHGCVIPEVIVGRSRPVPDEQRFPRPETVTEAELEGIRKLGGGALPAPAQGINDAEVNDLCEQVKALGIVRDEHGVRGPGLDGSGYYWTLGERGGGGIQAWPDEHGSNGPPIESPEPINSLAQALAKAHQASNEGQQRSRLAEAFLLVADYLLDQGQSLGAEGVYLMRDVLVREGRWEPYLDAALHAMGAGAFFVEGDAHVRSNMDFYAYHVRRLIRPCLEQPDAAEQVRWMNGWKAMLEQSILQPTSSLKIDGSAYHHVGHYHSYAQNAFANLPVLIEELRDTPWRLSPEVHQRLRRAMLAQRLYAQRLDLPVSLTGRSPFAPPYGLIRPHGLQGLDRLARLGTPDGTQEVDREVAAAYLRLVPEAADDEPYRSLGIRPEPDPQGTFVMPYAALLCHRRDNWLASVKGQSKYVWGSERQVQRNAYGLFMGLGNLEILAGEDPVSAEASGRDPVGGGWDWSRFEGTTVPQLPLEKLDQGWHWHPVIYSPETFVGGLSHKGRQGIFAMIVNQPVMPDTSLTGRKSWFFDDEHIICLGSDISCTEAEYPTQTTLCQKVMWPDEQGQLPATVIDGAELTVFPAQRVLDAAEPHWFLDVQQTGYYLPAGQNVTVARQRQTSRDVDDREDTEGDFLTAWIDHGTTPSNASYEYLLVVRATPQDMQRLAASPPYKVIQCDQNSHIVWHTAANRWGCVFFVPQTVAEHTFDAETLPVKAVDRPCLIMAEAVGDGQLDLSVADPDLNLDAPQDDRERTTIPHLGAFASGKTLGEGVSQPQLLRVTLRGAWRLGEATGRLCAWDLPEAPEEVRIVSSDAEETVLEILCRHGASYDISLAR